MVLRKLAVAVLFLTFATVAGASDRKYISNSGPGEAKLPFSDAVIAGDTLYVAGHIGLDPKTGQAPADPELEAHLVMDGIKKTVEAAGFSMDDIVSVQIFCTDLKLYDTFNNVYKTYFLGNYPARAFVGAANLLRNGHYEVMAIAVKRSH